MGEGSLSQDEIDALLAGAGEMSMDLGGMGGSSSSQSSSDLSPVDKDLISDILLNSFTIAGNSLGTILGKTARFINPQAELRTAGEVSSEFGTKCVCFYSNLSGSINGRATMILPFDSATKIAGLLMGGVSPSNELDMAQLQTLKDLLSPIMGVITVQMGVKLSTNVSGSPTEAVIVNSPRDLRLPDDPTLVKTQFTLNVEGQGSLRIFYILGMDSVSSILDFSKGVGKPSQSNPGIQVPMQGMGNQNPQAGAIGIKGVNFPSLTTAGQPSGNTNLDLLMDVQMVVTVELGRTKMYIKDILGLGEGSIIELDKLAGEPVDLLVNGKLIAKGEVVVIDENFGVRVTDIVSPQDRIKTEKG